MTKDKIECDKHGNCDATFMCNHLVKGEKLGFNCGYDENNTDKTHPDAWCNSCEDMFNDENGWTDKAAKYADIKVLCSSSYEEIRLKNWIEDENKFNKLISESYAYMKGKQEKLIEEYKLGSYERWDWDQKTGLLIFSHEGKEKVKAKIDFSGTFSDMSNTWLWAWGNSSLEENMKSESRKIRNIGESKNFMKLSSGKWHADEIDGWEMTTIMAKELNAKGVYRTPDENGFIYMIIRDIAWVSFKDKLMNF